MEVYREGIAGVVNEEERRTETEECSFLPTKENPDIQDAKIWWQMHI